jgi:2,4-dienoyl-CoA reductase-like NADH-dependent reductase (Old Yellow Enzyme family)
VTASAPAGQVKLFEPITLRGLTVKNRIWLSPMCQYTAAEGVVNDFHLAHYTARALGGFGLLIAEATGISPQGRITPGCAGIWTDEQTEAWARVVTAVHNAGAKFAIQLQHSGRKGSAAVPWAPKTNVSVTDAEGGWQTVGPTTEAFPGLAAPHALSTAEVEAIPAAFARAAERADRAGFDAVEIHGAHGYLVHQFLSPLSNTRTDKYGGSAKNRARLVNEIAEAIRAVFPAVKPVFIRVSASDWLLGGLTPEVVAHVVAGLKARGVDFCDTSSGALLPAPIKAGPGYQVPFARVIKTDAHIAVGAVGEITEADQAAEIVENGDADVVLLGRAALRDPMWPLRAAHDLGVKVAWPVQYERGAFN